MSFTTITVNAPRYIQYLYKLLKEQHGVNFVRRKLSSLESAFSDASTRVVFNCTGNGARHLKGIEDPKCYPTRGQILLTRAPQIFENVMRHGKDYETYIIPRPQSNGNVILGGYMQKGVRYVKQIFPKSIRAKLPFLVPEIPMQEKRNRLCNVPRLCCHNF